MKKYKIAAALLVICLFAASCSQSKEDEVTDIGTPAEETAQSMEAETSAPDVQKPDDRMVVEPGEERREPVSPEVPDSGHVFALTEEETAVYERLKDELSTDVFEGVSPVSIAKIYVKAGIDREWEAEYACHSLEYLGATKDEWKEMNERDVQTIDPESRQLFANIYFPLIEEGEFIEDGNRGYIAFHSVQMNEDMTEEDTYTEFHFIKNDKGIWEVRYRPTIQDFYEE